MLIQPEKFELMVNLLSSNIELETNLSQAVAIPAAALSVLDDFDDHIRNLEETGTVVRTLLNTFQRRKRNNNVNYIERVFSACDNAEFITQFRIGRKHVNDLINRFSASKYYRPSNTSSGRHPHSPEKHIMAFLSFAGHKGSYRDIASRFHMTLSSLHAVLTRVMNFLLAIAAEVIRLPTNHEKSRTENYFKNEKKIPGVVGVLGSTHVQIGKPSTNPQRYFTQNRKYSVQMQGIVNHERKFVDVFVGYPGSVQDSEVFEKSDIYPCLTELCSKNLCLIGTSNYPLMEQVMIPYSEDEYFTRKREVFNKTLSNCLNVIEQAYKELKLRFPQLNFCELRSNPRIVQFITACCVLHNIAESEDMNVFDNDLLKDRNSNNDGYDGTRINNVSDVSVDHFNDVEENYDYSGNEVNAVIDDENIYMCDSKSANDSSSDESDLDLNVMYRNASAVALRDTLCNIVFDLYS